MILSSPLFVYDTAPKAVNSQPKFAKDTNIQIHYWHSKTMETGASCQPTSIAPFRASPFKFSRCPNYAVATSSDKRAQVQTGKSVQLQDASVGGPRKDAERSSFTRDARVQERWVSFCNAQEIFQHNFPYRDWEEGWEAWQQGPQKKTKFGAISIFNIGDITRFWSRILGISGLHGDHSFSLTM